MSYQPQEPTGENGGKGKDRASGPIIQGKRYALPPDPHTPERRRYADRSNTTLLSKTEMAAKSKQMGSHPSAESFRIKAAEAAAKSKPAPGRMRSEEDPAVRKKDEAMWKAIGYPDGPPGAEKIDDYMQKSMAYLLVRYKQPLYGLMSTYQSAQAADNAQEHMQEAPAGMSTQPGPPDGSRDRAEKDSPNQIHRKQTSSNGPVSAKGKHKSMQERPADTVQQETFTFFPTLESHTRRTSSNKFIELERKPDEISDATYQPRKPARRLSRKDVMEMNGGPQETSGSSVENGGFDAESSDNIETRKARGKRKMETKIQDHCTPGTFEQESLPDKRPSKFRKS